MNDSNHNDLTYRIPPSKGRRLVVPDIHGCSASFDALLQQLKLGKNDQLFLLGDYVDRGPDSKGVIDKIIELKKKGYQVYPLRGNHEEMLLDTVSRYSELATAYLESNCALMLDKKQQLLPTYFDFLSGLPYYFELSDCFLVHAGFNVNAWQPFVDINSMVWIRGFDYDVKLLKGKKVIHGHTPIPLDYIQKSLSEGHSIINLDNGCVFVGTYPGVGNLVCLDLDSGELIVQENVE